LSSYCYLDAVKVNKRLPTSKSFGSELYQVSNQSFNDIALSLFYDQAKHNPLYAAFIENLGINARNVSALSQIPFLPISFFKRHDVKTGQWAAEASFASSGTTGMITSTHAVRDVQFYLDHAARTFARFYGDLRDYHFLALLPSYLERQNSSLVAMMDHFIRQSGSPFSGFYLHDMDKLVADIHKLRGDGRKTVVWGVTFALLDLAEQYGPDLSHCLVFETGGMKGRRREMTREELHDTLRRAFGVELIHSEYGMTELLSQAYSRGSNVFECPPWLKVIGRDVTDPFEKGLIDTTCGLNVIDLANWNTISFIETEDLGKVYGDGSFEVLGRFDNSDLRGCNLLVG
jgi:phenylacetate-coenzyme A ligase PaaK-like adenylate-forming protein